MREMPAGGPSRHPRAGSATKTCPICDHVLDEELLRCPSCLSWCPPKLKLSPLAEVDPEAAVKAAQAIEDEKKAEDGTLILSGVKKSTARRILTGGPWDALFGRQGKRIIGHARQGVTLLGGKAGAGKSTMALQIAASISASMCSEYAADAIEVRLHGDESFAALVRQAETEKRSLYVRDTEGEESSLARCARLSLPTDRVRAKPREVLYVAAEEGAEDILERYERIGLALKDADLVRLYPMGCNTDLATVLTKYRPAAVFLDSLPQFSTSDEDAVNLCAGLKPWAVSLDCLFIVIDHVTKSSDFRGLEQLQHVVDTTITLYQSGIGELREMTNQKNRYGEANVTIALLMTGAGLVGLTEEELARYVEEHEGGDDEEDEEEDG